MTRNLFSNVLAATILLASSCSGDTETKGQTVSGDSIPAANVEFYEGVRGIDALNAIVEKSGTEVLADLIPLQDVYGVCSIGMLTDSIAAVELVERLNAAGICDAEGNPIRFARTATKDIMPVAAVAAEPGFTIYSLRTNGGNPAIGSGGIDHAELYKNDFSGNQIIFQLSDRKLWQHITAGNIGRQIAIVIDGCVYCAPFVNMPIEGGKASVSGLSDGEARRLLEGINRGGKKHE